MTIPPITVFCPACGQPVTIPVRVTNTKKSAAYLQVTLSAGTIEHKCESA